MHKCTSYILTAPKVVMMHGMVVGLFFGSEFGLIYVGLKYTLASRTYILLYTAPLFAALGAHFFLEDDQLNPWKGAGLILSFGGVVVLFMKDLGSFSHASLTGDMMALGSGLVWGATTIYVKKYLAYRTIPLQTLFYQVFFSAPFLFIMSFFLERPMVTGFSLPTALSVFYQCIIVAFLSYLVWFELIHRYPVSLLHGFSFFTPVFGVFLSGALILREPLSSSIVIALILVCLGMILVNYQPASQASAKSSG